MQTSKLREAMMQIYDRVNSLDENCGVDPVEIRDIARAALAEPVKNCEVGSVVEQNKRFVEYCKNHRIKSTGHTDVCNPECPCRKGGDLNLCTLAWAQMSYEKAEGGSR